MTSDDHITDALIAALRSPALPAEQVGEAAAVSAMLEALEPVPARSRLRSRRGIALAAFTVASLGVGGLAAAGPGIFSPAADRPPTTPADDLGGRAPDPLPTPVPGDVDDQDDSAGDSAGDESGATARSTPPECETGTHGTAVSDVAQAPDDDDQHARGQVIAEAARQACRAGRTAGGGSAGDSASVECAVGNHGATVSDVAQATVPDESETNHGADVSDAARSACGKPATTGAADDAGKPDTTGAPDDVGKPDELPAPTAPSKPEKPTPPEPTQPPRPVAPTPTTPPAQGGGTDQGGGQGQGGGTDQGGGQGQGQGQGQGG